MNGSCKFGEINFEALIAMAMTIKLQNHLLI